MTNRHEDDELLEALGVELPEQKTGDHTPREERIIAGFEDIIRFYERHKRSPQHGEKRDIFERLYAVRLDQIRALPEARDLLSGMDKYGLLDMAVSSMELDDEALLDELTDDDTDSKNDLTILRHVRSPEDRRIAEEVATRTPCKDFARFKPIFDKVGSELKAGLRKTLPFRVENETRVDLGNFFILGGQIVYVAEKGEPIELSKGKKDARLRVIYSNGTESDLLLRSLERALYKDETGRRITESDPGPLFSGNWEEEDINSGTIYVLRSYSKHPFVTEHRELIHKIGVTGGKVESRIVNAAHESTYLLADVEIIATYKLSKISRVKLENILHKIFAPAQISITIHDRFGHPVSPKEWYLVPLNIIDEAVQRIRSGTITTVVYDPKEARLIEK